MPALNALTFGSQDMGDTKVTKWPLSIQRGRKDIILHVCDYLSGYDSDHLYLLYKMGKVCGEVVSSQ